MKKFKAEIEICIDENVIEEKYPNYRYNFSSPEEFAKHLFSCFMVEGETDMSKDGMETFGYSIKVNNG